MSAEEENAGAPAGRARTDTVPARGRHAPRVPTRQPIESVAYVSASAARRTAKENLPS